jgi:predicted permease
MKWFKQLFFRRRIYSEISKPDPRRLEKKTKDLVEDGLSGQKITSAALPEFGKATLTEERSCEVWQRRTLVDGFWADIRFSLRYLRKHAGFTIAAVLTLALGIGATTAVWSVTRAVLLQPLPYKDPGQLVVVLGELRKRNAEDMAVSDPDLMDLRSGAKTMFTGFASVWTRPMVLQQKEGTSELIHAATVTTNFFQLIGGTVALGRDFVESDDQPQTEANDAVAILSYDYWKNHYGGSAAILGHRLSEGPNPGPQIIGVLAPGFQLLFPQKLDIERLPDVWIAQNPIYDNAQRNNMSQWVVGRLRPGVRLQRAQTEVDRVAADLRKSFPIKQSSGFRIQLQPMHPFLVATAKPAILALMGGAGFLLLIACANVANLSLIRMSLRERELALRVAVGCTRWKLALQMLTEAMLLVAMGTLLGIGLAWLGSKELLHLAPGSLPRMDSVAIDPAMIGYAALLALITTALCGIGPALYASHPNLITALRMTGQSSVYAGGARLRNSVVVLEITLSFALLTGSGLMLRSILALEHIGAGFASGGLLTFAILEPEQSAAQQRDASTREIQDRLRAIPGVESVTAASPFPLADPFNPIRWGTEQALSDPSRFQAVDFQIVLPGYFQTLQTRLLAGRTFNDADNAPDRNVVVIDQLLAAKAYPHESAIGKRILIRIRTPEPEWVQIIGVVEHQRDHSLADVGREQIYFTDGFMGHGQATRWAIRTIENPANYAGAVRETVTHVGRQLVVTEMKPMDALMERAKATTRFSFYLIVVFAGIAALLASLGIYGTLATAVRQRTPEIGLRMALGSSRAKIFTLILARGMGLGALGIGFGFVLSLILSHSIVSLLVGIKSTDPGTFGSVAIAFLIIVVMASWLPARRAASTDPMKALRME